MWEAANDGLRSRSGTIADVDTVAIDPTNSSRWTSCCWRSTSCSADSRSPTIRAWIRTTAVQWRSARSSALYATPSWVADGGRRRQSARRPGRYERGRGDVSDPNTLMVLGLAMSLTPNTLMVLGVTTRSNTQYIAGIGQKGCCYTHFHTCNGVQRRSVMRRTNGIGSKAARAIRPTNVVGANASRDPRFTVCLSVATRPRTHFTSGIGPRRRSAVVDTMLELA